MATLTHRLKPVGLWLPFLSTYGDEIIASGIDAQTLREIALNYGADDEVAGNAVLFLNKTDLIAFGDVSGVLRIRH